MVQDTKAKPGPVSPGVGNGMENTAPTGAPAAGSLADGRKTLEWRGRVTAPGQGGGGRGRPRSPGPEGERRAPSRRAGEWARRQDGPARHPACADSGPGGPRTGALLVAGGLGLCGAGQRGEGVHGWGPCSPPLTQVGRGTWAPPQARLPKAVRYPGAAKAPGCRP